MLNGGLDITANATRVCVGRIINTKNLNKMTVEECFEEWWTPKELPEQGFNKTAMLDFAEMYHHQALRIPVRHLVDLLNWMQDQNEYSIGNIEMILEDYKAYKATCA